MVHAVLCLSMLRAGIMPHRMLVVHALRRPITYYLMLKSILKDFAWLDFFLHTLIVVLHVTKRIHVIFAPETRW